MVDADDKQNRKFTMKDITSRNPSSEVKAIYDQILVNAYKDQQKILKKAAKMGKE